MANIFDSLALPAEAAPAANPFDNLAIPVEDKGILHAARVGAEDALTFGFSDELAAARKASGVEGGWADTLIPFYGAGVGAYKMATGDKKVSADYDRHLADARAEMETIKQQHGVAMLGGQIAGGVIPAMLTGGGAAASTLSGRMLGGAATGALQGGVYGFGSGEGGLDNRLESAVPGALVGGALGTVIPAAVDVGTRQYLKLIGKTPAEIADEMGRKYSPRAVQNIQKNIADDGGHAAVGQEVRYLGDHGMLGQGGESLTTSAESIAKTPGPGASIMRNAVDDRAADFGRNTIQSGVDDALGTHATRMQVADRLKEAERVVSPLYETAKNIPGSFDVRGIQRAAQKAELATDGDVAAGLRYFTGLNLFDPKRGGRATVAEMHAAREAVDTRMNTLYAAGSKKPAEALKEFRDVLDENLKSIPSFAKADADWTIIQKAKSAVDSGRSILTGTIDVKGNKYNVGKMAPDEFNRWWGGLSKENRDGVTIGLRNAVDEVMGKVKAPTGRYADVVEAQAQARAFANKLSAGWTQKKLEAMLGPERYGAIKRLSDQAQSHASFRSEVVGGSRSAKLIEAQKMWPSSASAAKDQSAALGQRSLSGMALEAGFRVKNALTAGREARLRDEALADGARMLTTKGKDAEKLVRGLLDQQTETAFKQGVGGLLDMAPIKLIGASQAVEQNKSKKQKRKDR